MSASNPTAAPSDRASSPAPDTATVTDSVARNAAVPVQQLASAKQSPKETDLMRTNVSSISRAAPPSLRSARPSPLRATVPASFLPATNLRPCTKKDYNDAVLTKRFDQQWTSYYSNWFARLHDDARKDSMNAMRCFKYSDSTRKTLDQMNVYQKPFSPNARVRQHDSLYDVRFSYDVAGDGAFEEPFNVRTHHPATPEMIAIGEAFDREAYVRVHMSIRGSDAARAAEAELKTEGQYAYKYLLVELFLADGPHRWSLCVCYGIESPEAELTTVNLAQERLTRLNPEEADVINLHPDMALDIRPSLSDDSATWVPASSTGTVEGFVADPETGALVYLDPIPTSYEAPASTDTATHRFFLLPDSMYCLVPHSAKCAQDGNGGDFWVEFGGPMRRDGRFERLRVGYDPDGSLAAVIREVYA